MKISPTFLKWLGVVLIIFSVLGWPTTALTIAKQEPAVILGISWLALIFSGLSFYSSSQDGEEIDRILENQETIIDLLKK